MKINIISTLALTLFSIVSSVAIPVQDSFAAESSKKKVDFALPLKLVVGQPLTNKPDGTLPDGFGTWFLPFMDESNCAGVRLYPNIEIVRVDHHDIKPFKLINVDPKEINKRMVSGIQGFFGVKQKFDKVQEQVGKDIAAIKAPKELIAPAAEVGVPRVSRAVIGQAVEGLSNGATGVIIITKQKEHGEKIKEEIVKLALDHVSKLHVVKNTDEFHAISSKMYCETARAKKNGTQPSPMLLLDDAGLFTGGSPELGTGPLVDPPVQPQQPVPTQPIVHPPETPPAPNKALAQRHLDMAINFLNQSRDNTSMKTTRLREAVKELDAAIEADATMGMAYLNRGSAKLELGELQPAEADLAQAATLLPQHHGPVYSLALLYGHQGKKKEALSELDKAFSKGFKRIDDLRREKDLKDVVRMPEFEALLRQHKFIN